MKIDELPETKQLAIRHNHALFRLAGVYKTVIGLIEENKEHLSVADMQSISQELLHIEKYLRKAIQAKFEVERGRAISRRKIANSK